MLGRLNAFDITGYNKGPGALPYPAAAASR